MVGASGFEPPTSRLSVVCSSQLSYAPVYVFRSLKIEQQIELPCGTNLTLPRFCFGLFPNYEDHVNDLHVLHRKEVIQPHLPIRLPCYDLTPIIEPTFDSCLLAVSSLASGVPNSHGLTGGVYKARERIHRGMLIRDY